MPAPTRKNGVFRYVGEIEHSKDDSRQSVIEAGDVGWNRELFDRVLQRLAKDVVEGHVWTVDLRGCKRESVK